MHRSQERRATNLPKGARASAPAEIRSGQRYYLQAFTSPVLLHPKKDLKPVPLTGWPILHCRGAKTQSKLGRVPHVRDAPLSSRSKTSDGQRTARPTNAIVTACDCLGRRKPAAKITGGARASAPAEITLRLTLLLHRSYCSAISTPPKRPQTNPGHQQSLRPGWPRAKSTQARDRTGRRKPAAKMPARQDVTAQVKPVMHRRAPVSAAATLPVFPESMEPARLRDYNAIRYTTQTVQPNAAVCCRHANFNAHLGSETDWPLRRSWSFCIWPFVHVARIGH